MSANTTMVIAKFDFGTIQNPRVQYAAAVVQNAEHLVPTWDDAGVWASNRALSIFLAKPRQWFPTLALAKGFARTLRKETHVQYEQLLIVEIGRPRVAWSDIYEIFQLSKLGVRTPWSLLPTQVGLPALR